MAYLYCDKDLQDILFLLEDDDLLYKILNEFYDLALNLSDEEIFELVNINPIAKHYLKRDSGSLIGKTEAFDKIGKREFEEFAKDILIFSENVNTEEIRNKYGLLALQIDETFLEDQNFSFKYSFKKEPAKFNNWSDVFKLHPILPVNSAILIDNFLWSDINNFNNDNLENLYEIIANLIPKTLAVPFKLLIQIDNRDARLTKEKAKEKASKIEKYIQREFNKEIQVGISTQTNYKIFHERVLITNHHYMYSDKGFTIFKNKKVQTITKGSRNWVFFSIQNYLGELDKHHHIDVVKNVQQSIKFNNGVVSTALYNVGHYDNPLLNLPAH